MARFDANRASANSESQSKGSMFNEQTIGAMVIDIDWLIHSSQACGALTVDVCVPADE